MKLATGKKGKRGVAALLGMLLLAGAAAGLSGCSKSDIVEYEHDGFVVPFTREFYKNVELTPKEEPLPERKIRSMSLKGRRRSRPAGHRPVKRNCRTAGSRRSRRGSCRGFWSVSGKQTALRNLSPICMSSPI